MVSPPPTRRRWCIAVDNSPEGVAIESRHWTQGAARRHLRATHRSEWLRRGFVSSVADAEKWDAAVKSAASKGHTPRSFSEAVWMDRDNYEEIAAHFGRVREGLPAIHVRAVDEAQRVWEVERVWDVGDAVFAGFLLADGDVWGWWSSGGCGDGFSTQGAAMDALLEETR